MDMKLTLAHLDSTVVEEVPVHLWRRLFDEVAWPPSLAVGAALDHSAILSAFQADELADDLLRAVEVLHDLGTETGREAIIAALNDRRLEVSALPSNLSDRELALTLFLEQRAGGQLAEVFERAHLHVREAAQHRRYQEFMGRSPEGVTRLSARVAVLKQRVTEYCAAHDLGDHVDVRATEDDGLYLFNIVRSHHTKKPLAILPGRTARTAIAYRPVHGDIIRYDAHVGRLRIAARMASTVDFYRQALGRALFEDETFFFDGAAICDLRVLQERGRAAFDDHELAEISQVRMSECLWERSDRELHHVRARDCFRHIDDLHLPLGDGKLIQVKLKVDVVGTSTRPVTVEIRPPSQIDVRGKQHEDLIHRLLEKVGIRNPDGDPTRITLWTLAPWRHPVDAWRRLFGTKTDALVRAKVLKPIQLDAVPATETASTGNVLAAHKLPSGDLYGVSAAPEVASRTLTTTDLDGLELQPEQLRRHLRALLRLAGPDKQWDRGDLLHLGVLEIAQHRISVNYALRPPRPGLADVVRRTADGAHAVVLIPGGACNAKDLPHAILEGPIPSLKEAISCSIRASGLGDLVPAIHTAPTGARLVIDTQNGQIWIDGVSVAGLRPDTHAFKFMAALARSNGRALSNDTLLSALSPSRSDGSTAVRQAKRLAKQALIEALAVEMMALDPRDPFPSVGDGYRCAIVAHVV